MSRRRHVVFALFASLLMLTVAPSAAAQSGGGLVVGSQHTDFGTGEEPTPQTLENLTVSGSGDSASVSLRPQEQQATRDAFSDDTSVQFFGGDGVTGSEIGAEFRVDDPPNTMEQITLHLNNAPNGGFWRFDAYVACEAPDGDFTDGQQVRDSGTLANSQGDWTINFDSSVDLSNCPTATFQIHPSGDNGDSRDFDKSWTVGMSSTDTGTETLRTTESSYSGAVGAWVEKPVNSASYESAVHQVSNAERAAINIAEANNVSIEATVRTDSGTVLNQTTFSSTGNHSLTLADTSSEQLETVLNIEVTGSNPVFELGDESILFNNDAPTVDNSTASPTGDITAKEIELSIDASDPQFASAQGEELTATFYVDGESVGTDTLSSNSTASVNYTASTGGDHSWYVVLKDSHGASTTSDTFEFRAPSILEIRNESNPTELLDNGTVTLQFYGDESSDDPITVTRSVSDGTANMSGLPVDQPFVVVASADGFHDRRIFLSSLYDQQEIYLLPESEPVVQPTYVLEDFSGYFPQEDSVLAVQREINGSYQTVVGDYFGATGEFEATLREGVRHRLVITNTETGRSRVLGTTMATESTEKIVRVLNDDEIELVSNENRAPIVGPSLSTLPAATTDITITTYANESQSYNINITYQNESVTDTLATSTVSGNSNADIGIDLSDRSEGSVWVNISWTTSSGNDATKSVEYSVSKVYVGDQSLLDWISYVPGEFGPNADAVTSFISVLLTILLVGVVAGATRPSGQLLGLVGLAGLASFAVIGWLSYDVLFASTVGYFGIIAIREGL